MDLKNSYWIKSGAYSLGSRLATLFFGFGSFYFLVRSLPKEQFGSWALFLTIVTIVETSRNGLIQNALIKLLHSHPATDADKVITASWFINIFYSILIYSILAGCAGLISTLFDAPDLRLMFIYYGVTLMLLIPFSQFNYIQQSKYSFSGIFWSTLTRQGLFFSLIFYFHMTNSAMSLLSLVQLQSVCTFFGLIVAFFSARKFLIYKLELNWLMIKEVFHFGKYVMGTNISSLVFKSTDQLMVGFFMNPGSVALYNTAIRLSNLIEYPTTSIAEVVYPKSAAKFEEGGDASSKLFFEKSVALTMVLTLPVVVVTFLLADHIIYIIAGSEYAESANVLRITILLGFLTPFFRQFGTALDSSGRPHINFIVLLGGVFINLICNFIGIHYLGLMGAAYGTLCSYIIINTICYIIMKRIFKIELIGILNYMVGYFSQFFGLVQKKLKLKA